MLIEGYYPNSTYLKYVPNNFNHKDCRLITTTQWYIMYMAGIRYKKPRGPLLTSKPQFAHVQWLNRCNITQILWFLDELFVPDYHVWYEFFSLAGMAGLALPWRAIYPSAKRFPMWLKELVCF